VEFIFNIFLERIMTVVETASATSVQEVTQPYNWTLVAQQIQGHLWLSWKTNAPFRAQQGQISVYNKQSFPVNPQDDRKAWSWDDQNGAGSGWDTGLPYGSDWYCAWIAQKPSNGPYVYGVKLVTKE
jgi:hypothetical protein